MNIKTISAKRVDLNSNGLHVLCIPYDNDFYQFLIRHDKYSAVLTLYGGDLAQATDDETLVYLAHMGYNEWYQNEFAMMIEDEHL